MTSINYILLAHDHPKLLNRIISKLTGSNVFFYIHIDKDSDASLFKESLTGYHNVHFISDSKRQSGVWGGFGIVKATITAMEEIIKVNNNGYTIVLSGQDYPLQNASKIISFFDSTNDNYIESNPMPIKKWHFGGMDRVSEYRINLSNNRYNYVKIPSVWNSNFYNLKNLKNCYALIINNKSEHLKLLLKKRSIPYQLSPYAGSQWWALPNSTITKVLQFLNDHPEYTRYHEYTLLSDEIFFQMIIEELKKEDNTMVIKNTLTYTNWSKKNTTLPVTFTISDKEELQDAANKFLFARKFNLEMDSQILEWIDSNLH